MIFFIGTMIIIRIIILKFTIIIIRINILKITNNITNFEVIIIAIVAQIEFLSLYDLISNFKEAYNSCGHTVLKVCKTQTKY